MIRRLYISTARRKGSSSSIGNGLTSGRSAVSSLTRIPHPGGNHLSFGVKNRLQLQSCLQVHHPYKSLRFHQFSSSSETPPQVEIASKNAESAPEKVDRHQLLRKLLSYNSLKQAVVDRSEDFSDNPRFSPPLLRDVLLVLKKIPNDIPPGASMQMVETLVLPSANLVVPSHALSAVLSTVILSLNQTHNSNMKLTLEHALAAQDLVAKLQSIQIYYTTPYSPEEMLGWERSMTIAFNISLNFFASVAARARNPEAAKEVVQVAEGLLMEVGSSSGSSVPERLSIKPDVISFNTVIMAWAKSAPRDPTVDRHSQTSRRQVEAAANAAERSEAILKVMLEISEHLPSLKPTDKSFTAVITAWTGVRSEKAYKHVFDLLLPLMDRLHHARKGPPMTVPTLIMASKTLVHHKSAAAMHQHVGQILQYQRKFNLKLETVLCNAILSAYRGLESDGFPDSIQNAHNMLEFFNQHVKRPDHISYNLVVGGIRQAIQRSMKFDKFLSSEAIRLLKQAGDMADVRMQNDVLGALVYQPDAAELQFNEMGESVDYHSYSFLLTAYERSSGEKNQWAQKAEALLRRMEAMSERDHSLRPCTLDYNAVILAWLAQRKIESVVNAHSVLKGLVATYHGQLEKLRNSRTPFQIAERPNSTSFISIMAGYSKHGSLEHVAAVEDLLQEMGDMQIARSQASDDERKRLAPVEQNTIAANTLLEMYVKFSKEDPSLVRKAENLLKRLAILGPASRPDGYSYSILLKAYAGSHDAVRKTLTLLDLARRTGDKKTLDVRLYNSALNALSNSGGEGVWEAEQLLADMRKRGVMPDAFSYASVMKGLINIGAFEEVKRAEHVLQEAIVDKAVDSFCFNTVIIGYVKLGTQEAFERAQQLVLSMEEEARQNPKVEVSSETFQHLVYGGPVQVAHDILLKMVKRVKETGLRQDMPESRAFEHVISHWFRSDDSDYVSERVHELLRAKLTLMLDHKGPDLTIYEVSTVIRKLSKCGKAAVALELLEELYSNPSTRTAVCALSYHGVLAAYAKEASTNNGAATQACELLDRMEERFADGATWAEPDGEAHASCIEAWARTNEPSSDERAEEILQRMILRLGPDDPALAKAFNLVLRACKQQNDRNPSGATLQRAIRVFSDMTSGKFEKVLTPATFAYMLDIAGSSSYSAGRKLKLMEGLMIQCQKLGMVSEGVLSVFIGLVPSQQASRILRVPPEALRNLVLSDLPHEWTCNTFDAASTPRRALRPRQQ